MSGSMRISLYPGEKIYVNGAVLRVDRKVGLELLNNATFLLENHVIQAEDAATPLRQLYFVVQTMLMEPTNAEQARELFAQMQMRLRKSFSNSQVLSGLDAIEELVKLNKIFEALKAIRNLFPLEVLILTCEPHEPVAQTQAA
jgi:flagellar protein FlbT